jgi:alkaline phosphatase D
MKHGKQLFVLAFVCVALFLTVLVIRAAGSYKQQNRGAIAKIVDGDHNSAIKHFEKYLDDHPGDLESLYGLAVAYTRKNEKDKAIAYVKQAVEAGLPFGRFLAGPRSLLEPLTDSAELEALAKKHAVELLHGPTLGCVTDTSARFWVRTANEVLVQVFVSSSENMDSLTKSAVAKTNKDSDFTAVLAVRDLKPDTRYYYELFVDDRKEPKRWSFRTFPASGAKAKFQIGFGGGAGYNPQHERMWNTIVEHKPIAFLFLGDNVYIDNPTRPAVQRYCYYRRQCRPEFRDFAASTAIYAIWDDHDFTTNDGWGGPEIYEPAWKIPVWRVFRENWNNPYYAGGEKEPGCWFDFAIGDVDFFMLDCRYYRMNPRAKNPSMLGGVQKKWLFERLRASKGAFKVLASSVPWAFNTKPGSRDTWEGYKEEREEIFSFLQDNKIEGVFLLSADRHRSDVWKIERAGAYDLYEFESSRLTNVHTHKLMPGALFGYNKKCSFGLLSFDTTLPDPQVTYRVISIDNEVVHTLTLSRSQMK